MARSLRYKLPSIKIRAYDLNTVNLEAALADGAINDFDDLEGVVKVSDVVVLALPPLSNIDMIKKLSEIIGENSIVTDVSSVKTAIRAAVELAPEPFQRNFVLGHPIAGSERSCQYQPSPSFACLRVSERPNWTKEKRRHISLRSWRFRGF